MTTEMSVDLPELSRHEATAFLHVAGEVREMAADNAYKRPKMTTLVEEFAEAVLAARGKHDDPLKLELQQIASICINLLWQMEVHGEESIANLRTQR
jgi:hypothetical protein